MSANFSELEEGNAPSCPFHNDSSLEKILKTFAYCVMLLLALFGNIFLVCVVYSQRRLRTTTNFLISNMAISDLLVPVFAMPRTIVEIHLGLRRWLFTNTLGLALCKVIYFLQDVSTAVSVLSLSCITLDRFYAVVRPQSSTPIKGYVRTVIASIWIIAMLMHAAYFYAFQLVTVNDVTYCILLWPSTVDPIATKIFFLTLIILLYFIPLILIIVLQWFIVKKLKKQRLPSFSSSFRQRKRGKRNKKVVHFTLAVIVTFFICWTPTVVYSFIVIFGETTNCIPELFRFSSLFLVQSNSSINFFIYFLFNDNYRNTFKKIFCHRDGFMKTLRQSGAVQLTAERKRAHSKTLSLDLLPDKNYRLAENMTLKSPDIAVHVTSTEHCLECSAIRTNDKQRNGTNVIEKRMGVEEMGEGKNSCKGDKKADRFEDISSLRLEESIETKESPATLAELKFQRQSSKKLDLDINPCVALQTNATHVMGNGNAVNCECFAALKNT
ncbi:neuropeptide Y receptor type 6-like [Actinia tenebrosa]|uniref:Neuropeptide Y receptor type 6-like n=1 Tax=Actinia tenebrosa TaxID=6105 RepID=A0A6P8I6I4_ACTTE|nr:neuropeptide Y receptor type 6-like [Actinia tenebrosa]XP_031560321.1 neuropeptide Y receptor type 6-like [Actinia tenebrosa]